MTDFVKPDFVLTSSYAEHTKSAVFVTKTLTTSLPRERQSHKARKVARDALGRLTRAWMIELLQSWFLYARVRISPAIWHVQRIDSPYLGQVAW